MQKPVIRLVMALAATLSLSGCCASEGAHLGPKFDILTSRPTHARILSKEVLLMADSQIHYLYGEDPYLRTELTDKLIGSAVRPPQLDFFGRYLLDWTVAQYQPDLPILFLGDALDLSCTQEWQAFVGAMAARRPGSAPRPWFLTPGNHDGYYFGVLYPGTPPEHEQWKKACGSAGQPLTKKTFVERYLRSLAAQDDPGARAFTASFDRSGAPSQGSWRYDGPPGSALLTAIAWDVSRADAPWKSYVVQEIDLTRSDEKRRVTVFLLDTAAYDRKPDLVGSPDGTVVNTGLKGDIVEAQASVVRAWAHRARSLGALVFPMGHHPYDALRRRGRALIDDLRTEYGAPIYVSAHTHEGQWFVHDDATSAWPELNIGSMLDWPPEDRLFVVMSHEDRLIVRSRLHRAEVLKNRRGETCDPSWEVKPGEPDFYLTYQDYASMLPEVSQGRLFDALLGAHQRLLRLFPTDASRSAERQTPWPACCRTDEELQAAIARAIGASTQDKRTLLVQLEGFERTRATNDDEKRTSYQLCQALWSSKYERLGARAPVVDDWMISFPAKK